MPAASYLAVFRRTLELLGEDAAAATAGIELPMEPQWGDLSDKLGGAKPNPYVAESLQNASNDIRVVAGHTDLSTPLGSTWQKLQNDAAPIDKTYLLLGDSHSSIFSGKKLNYLFAGAYAGGYFHWNPCAVRAEVDPVETDCIIMEISSRFTI